MGLFDIEENIKDCSLKNGYRILHIIRPDTCGEGWQNAFMFSFSKSKIDCLFAETCKENDVRFNAVNQLIEVFFDDNSEPFIFPNNYKIQQFDIFKYIKLIATCYCCQDPSTLSQKLTSCLTDARLRKRSFVNAEIIHHHEQWCEMSIQVHTEYHFVIPIILQRKY